MQLEQDTPASVLVRVSLLGPLEISKRDQSGNWKLVPKDRWKNSKPARSVFKRLLVQPGRRLSRSTIEDDLWSDTDNFELAVKNVYNAISLIRGIVGKSLVTCWDAAYEIAGQALVWTDIDACEALLKEAENRGQGSIQAFPFLEQALSLLERGELLEGENGKWCYAFRRRAENMLRQVHLWLAESYETQGKLWQAGEQYRATILTDPSDEEALQHWLEMLTRHGKRQEALKCYQEMKAFMEAQGFSVSNELEQVIASLNEQPVLAPLLATQVSESVLPSADKSEDKDMDKLRRKLGVGLLGAAGIAFVSPTEELFDPAFLPQLLQTLNRPSNIDEQIVSYLANCTKHYWQDYNNATFAPYDLLQHVSRHLKTLKPLLQGSLIPAIRARLCSVTSETALLVGVLLLEMGFIKQMKDFCVTAIRAGREGDNLTLEAVSWGWMNFAYNDNPKEALHCIQKARCIAKIGVMNTKTQAWLAAVEAEIQARLNNPSTCLRTLDEAQSIGNFQNEEESSYWTWFNSSLLEGYKGNCFQRLYDAHNAQTFHFLVDAQTALQAALTSLDPTLVRSHPYYLIDLASTYVQQGEIEEACSQVIRVVEVPFQLRSHTVVQRLKNLRQDLDTWKDIPDMKDLDSLMAPLLSSSSLEGMV